MAELETVLRFSGGERLHVAMSLDEVRAVCQKALQGRALVEFASPNDTRRVIVNPMQIQFICVQEGDSQ